jgi:hypothetical protein
MKRELIMVATMIAQTTGTSAFSDPTEFSVTTGVTEKMLHVPRSCDLFGKKLLRFIST